MTGRGRAAGARIAGWAGAVSAIGTPGVIAVTHPELAAALFGAELVGAAGFVLTLVFASEERVERIFRLLRLLKGEAEPAAPAVRRAGRRRSGTRLVSAERVDQPSLEAATAAKSVRQDYAEERESSVAAIPS